MSPAAHDARCRESAHLGPAAGRPGRWHGPNGWRSTDLFRRVRLDHGLARYDVDGVAALVVLAFDPQDPGQDDADLQGRAIRQFVRGPGFGFGLKVDLLRFHLALRHRRDDLDHRCRTFSRTLSAPAKYRIRRARGHIPLSRVWSLGAIHRLR